jgi:hypothetical protein
MTVGRMRPGRREFHSREELSIVEFTSALTLPLQ